MKFTEEEAVNFDIKLQEFKEADDLDTPFVSATIFEMINSYAEDKVKNLSSNNGVIKSLPPAEELWDDYSELIDDNIHDLERFAGTTVITKTQFMAMMKKLDSGNVL